MGSWPAGQPGDLYAEALALAVAQNTLSNIVDMILYVGARRYEYGQLAAAISGEKKEGHEDW